MHDIPSSDNLIHEIKKTNVLLGVLIVIIVIVAIPMMSSLICEALVFYQ